MHQKFRVPRGKCIKKGQILADGAATVGGELALGKNVLVAYMPWEGYNSEDAVLISERLVYEDIYTSFHIRKYEIHTHVTSQGPEKVTNEIPHLEAHLLRNLDKKGIVMLGSWVETGDILVGKLTPQVVKESSYAPEDRLLRAILGIQVSTSKETCLKLPIGGESGRLVGLGVEDGGLHGIRGSWKAKKKPEWPERKAAETKSARQWGQRQMRPPPATHLENNPTAMRIPPVRSGHMVCACPPRTKALPDAPH
jgi:hypothetical protein